MAANGNSSGGSGYGAVGSAKGSSAASPGSRYAGSAVRYAPFGNYLSNPQSAYGSLNPSPSAKNAARPGYGDLPQPGIMYHSELVSMVISGQSGGLYAKAVELSSFPLASHPSPALPRAQKGWYESVRNPLQSLHYSGNSMVNNLEARLPGIYPGMSGLSQPFPSQPLPFFGGGGGGGDLELIASDPSQQIPFLCPICGNPQLFCICRAPSYKP